MKALLIILILLATLILGVAIGVRCHRRLAKKQASRKSPSCHISPRTLCLTASTGDRGGENVYDEADSLLCVGRLLPDGSVISMKYNGMGEKSCLSC